MFLPAEIIPVLWHFRPAFQARTYEKAVELLIGTLLARGRRTVTSALRALGKAQTPKWSKYHQVLNRARWSGLVVSRLLLELIVATFVTSGERVTIAVDETLERRWGPQIRQCGHWRDSRSSSKRLHVSTRGLRWLVFAVVVQVPWSEAAVALPFLSVLLTTPKVSAKLGKRHKTVAQVTGQVVIWLRRSLVGYPLHLVGDGAYAVIELGLLCQRCQVTLIAPLRLDARLFEPPARLRKKAKGRPALVGGRLPALTDVVTAPRTHWQRSRVPWYGATTAIMDWTTGTALWYATGRPPLCLRWILVRDPAGQRATRAFFSTDLQQSPPALIRDFVVRWSLEVTFEESRAHLGIETQRQWSELAIVRTTPALFGLFSLVVLMANALQQTHDLPCEPVAWYAKRNVTFHDLLRFVRRCIWHQRLFQTSALAPDLRKLSPELFDQLLSAVCY
jgi:ribosomal protein L28